MNDLLKNKQTYVLVYLYHLKPHIEDVLCGVDFVTSILSEIIEIETGNCCSNLVAIIEKQTNICTGYDPGL